MAGNNKQQERAVNDEGSNEEGEGFRAMTMVMRMGGDKEGKGNSNQGGRQRQGRGQQGNGKGNRDGG
jgi:hypothetical protein